MTGTMATVIEKGSAKARDAGGTSPAARSLRILNVDDQEVGRYLKTRMLRLGGHEVVEARSGGEALVHLGAGGIDLVLLDVKLPDMSGFEVARRIRLDERLSHLPIVQVSEICVTRDDEADGLGSGADAFLRPPLRPGMLLRVVAETAERKRTSAAPAGSWLDPHIVDRVASLVRARLADPPTVRELALAAGMSEFHFARRFKAATGDSPHGFVIRARIAEAMRLLRGTDRPLREIASNVGYRTHAHFSAAFLSRTGMRPSAYRATFRDPA